MDSYDVAVIGGGPAGYSAALKAAEFGAKVVLIEAEKPGGACVHHTCIPTNTMLGAALTYVDARELDVMGVLDAGERFNLARASARRDALVDKLQRGIQAALRMRKVILVQGHGSFRDEHVVDVMGGDSLWAETIVIATGARWEVPSVPGVPADRVLTPDQVLRLPQAPASAVILGGGPADTAFALEYATLMAIAGSEVSVVTPRPRLLPALDVTVAAVAVDALTSLGIGVFESASCHGGEAGTVQVISHSGEATVDGEIVVAADPRVPSFASLNLGAAGVNSGASIPVDAGCRTNVRHLFAAGDVTGGAMLSNVAAHMGEVAGVNAAGGKARTRLARVPHLLHTIPEIAWIGLTEEQARGAGHDVVTGVSDLSFNPRAISLGAREGIVKVIAERELGEVLGVHAVGPGAGEILAIASAVMQSEVPLADLASMLLWHPSISEGLVEAARRVMGAVP